jgi:hypothetical protein
MDGPGVILPVFFMSITHGPVTVSGTYIVPVKGEDCLSGYTVLNDQSVYDKAFI